MAIPRQGMLSYRIGTLDYLTALTQWCEQASLPNRKDALKNLFSEVKARMVISRADRHLPFLRSIVEQIGASGAELSLDTFEGCGLSWPAQFQRGNLTAIPIYFGEVNSGQLVLADVPQPLGSKTRAWIGLSAELLSRLVQADYEAQRTEGERLQLSTAAADSEHRFRVLADSMPQMVWSTLPDGYHDYYNQRWYEFTGMPEGSTDGEAWNGMFHTEDQPRAWKRWRQSLETGEPYEIEYRLRSSSGEYRWTLGRALPMRDSHGGIVRWFGTCTDIHDQKMLQEQRQLVTQELSHRIKNIFAIVAGLVSLAARQQTNSCTVLQDVRERILALGRAHDYVRPHSPASAPSARPATLNGLLIDLLEPYVTDRDDRILVHGLDFPVDDQATTPIALIFHELATNSAKYGGLSAERGSVVIEIGQTPTHCVCTWMEEGGPGIDAKPNSIGFGSSLLNISIRQLGGSIDKEWKREGLMAVIEIPIKSLQRKV